MKVRDSTVKELHCRMAPITRIGSVKQSIFSGDKDKMAVKNLKSFCAVLFFGSILIACGDSDSGSKSAAPAPEASAPAAPAPEPTETASSETMEKAEGVVYQDEIYKNWPYQ